MKSLLDKEIIERWERPADNHVAIITFKDGLEYHSAVVGEKLALEEYEKLAVGTISQRHRVVRVSKAQVGKATFMIAHFYPGITPIKDVALYMNEALNQFIHEFQIEV